MRRYLATTAALGAAILVTACGPGQPAATTAVPVDTIVSTIVGTRAQIPDGETFAWVKGVTADGILVDPAEMLTGEEANEAAVEAGVVAPGEGVPNDYFIDDPSDETFTLAAAGDATYELMLFVEGSPVAAAVTSEEFAGALDGSNPDVYGVVQGVIPAMVEITDGRIARISQVYLP